MQTCSKCKKEKELDQFGKGNKKNGTSSWCKECTNTKGRLRYDRPGVRERAASNMQKLRRNNPERTILNTIRNRARRSGIPFNLTIEDCAIPTHCPVLGIPLVFMAAKVNGIINDNSPSVDKIDPAKGYTKGNVSVISWRANHLKNNATLHELEAIYKYVRDAQL